jgi:uncharacterized protein YdcH (DUF465 family)
MCRQHFDDLVDEHDEVDDDEVDDCYFLYTVI